MENKYSIEVEYTWECPECGHFNTEDEDPKIFGVECHECEEVFGPSSFREIQDKK